MDLYIDKENLLSFFKSKDKEDFEDCLRMLKRQLHIVFNIDKESIKSDELLRTFILKLSEGRGQNRESDSFLSEKFPIRPIKSNSCKGWDRAKLCSVYLIDDEDSSKLKEKGCVLLGSTGEELITLIQLFCGADYNFHHLYDLQKSFNSWQKLKEEKQPMPCTDIVINDRYLFGNQYEVVEYNLSEMLDVLSCNVKNCINVVIFTLKDKLISFSVDRATNIIKKKLKNNTGINPNITFIASDNKDILPHDRFIITNYRLYRSGDSFIYFNTRGGLITKGGSLDVDSTADSEVYIFVESLLEKLQNSFNKIVSLNSDNVFGNKESNFLKL